MEKSSDYTFSIPIKVRDYEVDAEGIVNNANYLHYMELTRHEFCEMAGLSFRVMHERGLAPVVTKIEIAYRKSLGLGDSMVSCLNLSRIGPQFVFQQDIFSTSGEVVTKATVYVACLKDGQLSRGEELAEAFKDYLK